MQDDVIDQMFQRAGHYIFVTYFTTQPETATNLRIGIAYIVCVVKAIPLDIHVSLTCGVWHCSKMFKAQVG
jgi:hypothetical protein